jgi:hypothetical protein
VPTDGVVPAVFEGRNANSDDAPPALPAGLQGLTSASTSRRSPPAASAAANRTVRQASAEQPLIMPQVNPASAIATEVGEGGLQQAIYFEATDLGTN